MKPRRHHYRVFRDREGGHYTHTPDLGGMVFWAAPDASGVSGLPHTTLADLERGVADGTLREVHPATGVRFSVVPVHRREITLGKVLLGFLGAGVVVVFAGILIELIRSFWG